MDQAGSIRLGKMFCPANDRNVPILFRHPWAEDDRAPFSGPGVPFSCLDFGVRCTGWLCPHFAAPELPAGSLLERALSVERERAGRGTSDRRRILERALREQVFGPS